MGVLISCSIYRYRTTPWIDVKNNEILTDGDVKGSDFTRLQKFLAQPPRAFDERSFKTTTGLELDKHEPDYVNKDVVGKVKSPIAPFTLKNMMVVEVGDTAAKKASKLLLEQVGNSEFYEYLGTGDVTAEQLNTLRENIQQKVNEQLGPLGEVINKIDEYTWDWWRNLEESLQEQAAGLLGDDARDYFANYEVPETFSAQFCEEIVK